MQEEVIIPTTDQINKVWNTFSEGYSRFISPNYLSLGLQMAHLVNITEAESILEVACGDGSLSAEICLLKPVESKFYSSDLSINMCKRTFASVSKITELLNQPLGVLNYRQKIIDHKENLDINEIELGEDNRAEIELFNYEVIQSNNEILAPFKDNSIDAYIASLSLHGVNNPDKMIQQCLRVLKPGGKACFSVWGLKENSYFFTTIGKIMKKFELGPKGNTRTSWHLNDREKLVERFKKNGFNKVLSYYGFNALRWFDEEFLRQFVPAYLGFRKLQIPDKTFDEIVEAMKKEFRRVQEEEEIVIGFSALIVLVEKDLK